MENAFEPQDFYANFMQSSAHRKYVFGINQYADIVAQQIALDGYIDDFSEAKSRNGLPVLKLTELDPSALILNCISSIYLNSARLKLDALGFKNIGHYIQLADLSAGKLKQVEQISDSRTSYAANPEAFVWVKGIFADAESLDTYNNLLAFRLTGNLQAMQNYTYRVSEQYFPGFLDLEVGEIFVDGGGFDGETSIEFIKRCPEYAGVHIFEPGHQAFKKIELALNAYPHISFYNQGLYSTGGTISFDSSGGSHSAIITDPNPLLEQIQITTLDKTISGAVSFIKLDIEGAELDALHGMAEHILHDHPKLAIAVYHRADDFWKIPQYILGLRKDYQVYLRHYTEGWSETVMYFIPVNSSSGLADFKVQTS